MFQNPKRIIRKRSFLLFELLLSLTLLLLCLFPLLKTHLGLAQGEGKEIAALKEVVKQEADLCLLKTQLYERKVSWEKLIKGVELEGYSLKKIDQVYKHNGEKGILLCATRKGSNYKKMIYVEKALPNSH